VLIRAPLIPAFNDTEENMLALAGFMRECGFTHIELMPYHSFGLNKYRALGLEYAPGCSGTPDTEASVALLEQSGLEVTVHQ
jgi:pyruvate formate lyase activating enzyme